MNWLNKNKTLVHKIEAALFLILIVVLFYTGYHLYRQKQATEAQIAARDHSAVDENRISFGETVTFDGKTYRRSNNIKAILCIGVDRSGSLQETKTTGFGGQADGVFLIAQDTARNSLKILMIPRDTMTDITFTDLSGNVLGKDVQHLTLAYAYGDGREKSCEFMSEAVSDLLGGLSVDHYMAIDMDAISILNDTVGGVTVTIPTDGMEKADASFIKGEQVTLTGKQAERFIRFRDTQKSHSALYRMDQQEEYMLQFFRTVQVTAKSNNQIVPELFGMIQDHMITNMAKDEYLKIGVDVLNSGGISSEDFQTLPGRGVATAKYDEFYPDEDELKRIVLDLFYREEI